MAMFYDERSRITEVVTYKLNDLNLITFESRGSSNTLKFTYINGKLDSYYLSFEPKDTISELEIQEFILKEIRSREARNKNKEEK